MLVVFAAAGPLWLGLWLSRDATTAGPRQVGEIAALFDRHGYRLGAVADGGAAVPRIFVARLPRDWADLARVAARKRMFTKLLLPIVLRANEGISNDRRRLRRVAARLAAGTALTRNERGWLDNLAAAYKTDPRDPRALLLRVDGVPPSLAVAQAAVESGWGTSRFAAEGNALYGQWIEEGPQGMVPASREPGRTYAIQRFESLSASVEAYLRNLNTHRAYRAFRRARAMQRRAGGVVRGAPLAPELRAYSQDGIKYVQTILAIIEKNGLDALDRTTLAP